jgi:hypothetical protein
MSCLIVIAMLFFPRVVLFCGWAFGFLTAGFQGWFWPLVGFIFMPITTIVFALANIHGNGVEGWWLGALILAILFDVGSHSSTVT